VAFSEVTGQPALELLPILVLQALGQVLPLLQRPKPVVRPPIEATIAGLLELYYVQPPLPLSNSLLLQSI
jgi:hypothetical protein